MVDRVASLLPTVRARLYALVLIALVPALVILGYDEWLARERGLAALTDSSLRIVRLLQREIDDRITRGVHRLQVLAADPDVISLAPAATRKLVDAVRDDRLYNNLLMADGRTGVVRSSAVPMDREVSVRGRIAFERARQTLDVSFGAFLPEPATREPGVNLAQPVVNDVGVVTSIVLASIDFDWASGFIESAGLPGDFNLNGIVDAADFVVWRKGLGATYTQSDYNIWRAHFGQTAGSGANASANAAMPEPATFVLLIFAAAGSCLRRSRAA